MEKYSVLMSVYYKEKPEYLEASINSMLTQTVPPSDFVLVCDGSLTQKLEDTIERFRTQNEGLFQIVRLGKNMGLGIALNQGLQCCKNEIVARMDSDDLALPNRIERQLDCFQKNPGISVVGGQIAEFIESPDKIVSYREVALECNEIRNRIAFRNPMNHMTVVLRKQDVLEVGNYQTLIGFEDYHLWARLLAQNKQMINLPDILCYVRISGAAERRGGWGYFKNAKILQDLLYQMNLIKKSQYIVNILIRFVASVLLPTKVRSVLQNNFMRKKKIS